MNDGSHWSERPREVNEPSFQMSSRQLGMAVFLGSLTVLFAASLVAYLLTRANQDQWRAAEAPGLPLGLIASTVLLVGVSIAQRYGLKAIRENRHSALSRSLWVTTTLAVGFMVGQALNWAAMVQVELEAAAKSLYVFTFVSLTGLHALHVLGGIVPLAIVILHHSRREYSSSRHEGVKLCVQYWDFLLVVWVVLLTTLWVAN